MTDADAERFLNCLTELVNVMSGKQVALTKPFKAGWWRQLKRYPLEIVEAAFNAYLEHGDRIPTPKHIHDIIKTKDGRPEVEEAWAIAIRAADETQTVIWTEEIAQAWYQCQPIYQQGDKIGARMAFKQAYERLLIDARSRLVPKKLSLSLGTDPEMRRLVLQEAAAKGAIGAGRAISLITQPEPLSGAGLDVAALIGYDKGDSQGDYSAVANIVEGEIAATERVTPEEEIPARIEKLRADLRQMQQQKVNHQASKALEEAERRRVLKEQERQLLEQAKENYANQSIDQSETSL